MSSTDDSGALAPPTFPLDPELWVFGVSSNCTPPSPPDRIHKWFLVGVTHGYAGSFNSAWVRQRDPAPPAATEDETGIDEQRKTILEAMRERDQLRADFERDHEARTRLRERIGVSPAETTTGLLYQLAADRDTWKSFAESAERTANTLHQANATLAEERDAWKERSGHHESARHMHANDLVALQRGDEVKTALAEAVRAKMAETAAQLTSTRAELERERERSAARECIVTRIVAELNDAGVSGNHFTGDRVRILARDRDTWKAKAEAEKADHVRVLNTLNDLRRAVEVDAAVGAKTESDLRADLASLEYQLREVSQALDEAGIPDGPNVLPRARVGALMLERDRVCKQLAAAEARNGELTRELDQEREKVGLLMQPPASGDVGDFPWQMMRMWSANYAEEKQRWRKDVTAAERQRGEATAKLAAAEGTIARMNPVVAAALWWSSHHTGAAKSARLLEACRAYRETAPDAGAAETDGCDPPTGKRGEGRDSWCDICCNTGVVTPEDSDVRDCPKCSDVPETPDAGGKAL